MFRNLTLVVLAFLLGNLQAADRPNILMIAVDDLRPELHCYGATHIQSPHIDGLAAGGIRFDHAYCQVAVCGASRGSLLSGCRPETTRLWDYKTPMRSNLPDIVSLPQHLKENGYTTISLGKIYHSATDDLQGWSEKPWRPSGPSYLTPESKAAMQPHKTQKGRIMGPATENGGDVEDNAYPDGKTADEAVARLETFAANPVQPFFLAVGFTKPHLPFIAPGKYWDLYDRDSIAIPSREDPLNSPVYARSTWGELRAYTDMREAGETLNDEDTRRLIHGYYASVSYTDRNVGHVLAALDRLELAANTVIILWGDHGWYVGDFGDWCKHSNDEIATRVPMIMRVPGQTSGQSTKAMAEFVDIFPTLSELAGLQVPEHCQGTSLVPVIENPDRPWKEGAFSQYYKTDGKRKLKLLGTSLRTERWRYTEWRVDKTGELDAVELYDLQNDPGATKSVHGNPENAPVLERLAELAKSSGTGLKPPGS